MFYFLIFSFFSTFLLGFPLTFAFLRQKNINHLLFLTFCNALFFLATAYFYFTLHDSFLAFFSSFFFAGYSLFLVFELKKEKAFLLSFPYLIFAFSFLIFLIFEIFF